ncbi:MAG: pentapeptide repeat-containing protein, partial [Anaerolineaceae bacterium]
MNLNVFRKKPQDNQTRSGLWPKKNAYQRIRLRLAEEKVDTDEVLAHIRSQRGWKLRWNNRPPWLFSRKTVDLSWAILCGVHIRRQDLRDLILVRANLSNADLYGSNLSGVDLSRANLAGADLSLVDLSGATLDEAVMIDVSLPRASLDGCWLR